MNQTKREIFWSWLAGFIDGEGFVGIIKQYKKETRAQSSTPLYHPYIIISNNYKNVIAYIHEYFEFGRIHKLNPSGKSRGAYQI